MLRSFVLAGGLLVTNILLLPAEQRDQPRKVDDPEIQVRTPAPRAEEPRLQALRFARFAGFRAIDCPHFDPLATLDADIDPEPGREHVIGNRRHGVAMFAEDGRLLAMMRGVGCASEDGKGDQSLSIGADGHRLVIRTRDLRADGEYLTGHVVVRRGEELVTRATVDLGGDRGEWAAYGALSFDGDTALVKTHGRTRVAGEWRAVDDHTTTPLQ